MKRLLVLFAMFLLLGGETGSFADSSSSVRDSLLKVLESQPADVSRLKTLYALSCIDVMAPSSLDYFGQLLDEAGKQKNVEYQCLAMYAYVVYYFNHQDEENTELWMDRLSKFSSEHKFYHWYFPAKRAEITMQIVKGRIEYSITEAEEMYELAKKMHNARGMSSAKLCLMTGYLMTARYKEGEEAGFEAYRLLPSDASLEEREEVLQEITMACSSTKNKDFLKYLQEYEAVLNQKGKKGSGYLLLEALYADFYLAEGKLEQARYHLKKMDKYYSPTTYIPSRGLYNLVYSHYYRYTQEYDKALAYADSAISLLAAISDKGGVDYEIERAGILADAGRTDEAIPLFQNLLAKKDSFYIELSTSQMDELHQMSNIDKLLLEKEQHKTIIHYIALSLIVIALLVLIPSVVRIYSVRKRLRKEEEEIRKMTLVAEEANSVKTDFLASMSYNIRLSLNNVLGFSQLLTMDSGKIDASQWKEYSRIVQTNSAELIQLVNDVLDLSRLEAGRTKWQIEDYDIIPLCVDALAVVSMRSENLIKVDFKTDIESQPIRVDINRFTQVLVSTLLYPGPCKEERTVFLSLEHDSQKSLLVFRVINSPLADPAFQTQKVEVRHSINRMTLAYFNGTYAVEPDAAEGPTVVFTYSNRISI